MLRGASLELPEPPARPPPPNPLKVLHLRCSKPPDTAEVQLETCNSPHEDLSRASPAQAVTSDALSAVLRRSYNATEKARSSLECSERPARPPPPDPSKVRAAAGVQSPTIRTSPSQTTETQVLDGHLEASHIQTTETDHVHDGTPTSVLQCADVFPDQRRLTSPITRPHPPPLPTPRPPPAVVRPRKPFRSQTAVEDPVEHVYECIEDILPEGETDNHGRRPARPPLPENSKILHLLHRRPPMLSQIRPMRCPTPPKTEVVIRPSVEDQDIPEYIDVLSDLSSAQDAKHVEKHDIRNSQTSQDDISRMTDSKPNGPDESKVAPQTSASSPPPVLPRPRKPLLTQSALEESTGDVRKHKRIARLKDKETLEKTRSLPAAMTRQELEAYRSWSRQCKVSKQVSSKHSESPARPPPPDATKVRHLRPSKSADPYVRPIKCPLPSEPALQTNPPLQDQDIPEYIHILPDSSYSQGLSFKKSLDYQNTETFQNDVGSGATSTVLLYEDIVPDVCGLTNGATPVNIHPPVVQPRPAVVRPRKPFLSQSTEPVEHVYEHIEDVLTELPDDRRSRRSLPGALSQRGYSTYRSWSEQSSVYEDSTTKELDLLLDWWRRVGDEDMLPVDRQAEGRNHIISTAQRLKTAMRLYELLLFQRCTLLLNYITDLHCTADGIIKTCKKARIGKLMGGTTGAMGGVAIAAGLALAPLTFGASAVAAGVGVGVMTVGGFTGASATLGKKVKGTQLRNKVEKIFENYNTQMEDITDCLKFIVKGLERLKNQDHWKLMDLDVYWGKVVQAALESDSLASIEGIIASHRTLQSWEACFQDDDNPSAKKTSDSKFAEKVHEVADKLKEEVDDLSRIRKFFSSISDQL